MVDHDQRNILLVFQDTLAQPKPGRGRFIAGIFETAGEMTIESGQVKKISSSGEVVHYPYTRPTMTYTDTRKGKIDHLVQVFGGRALPERRGASTRWVVRSMNAVEIASLAQEYAPGRQTIINAFQAWGNSHDNTERLRIAAEARQYSMRTDSVVTVEDYRDLVTDAQFIAGVIEARGAIDTRNDQLGYLLVTSTNSALLLAIKEAYGGGITEATAKSKVLSISKVSAIDVITKSAQHLLTWGAY